MTASSSGFQQNREEPDLHQGHPSMMQIVVRVSGKTHLKGLQGPKRVGALEGLEPRRAAWAAGQLGVGPLAGEAGPQRQAVGAEGEAAAVVHCYGDEGWGGLGAATCWAQGR